MLEAVAFLDERREMVEKSEVGWRSGDLTVSECCFNAETQSRRGRRENRREELV